MDLNIRNVSPELIRKLKVAAAGQEKTLRDFCMELLEVGLEAAEEFSTAALVRPRR